MTWEETYKIQKRYELKYIREFLKVFKRQLNIVLNFLRETHDPEKTVNQIDVLVTEELTEEAYLKLYRELFRVTAKNPNIEKSLEPDWEDIAEDYVAKEVAKNIVTVTESTRRYMKKQYKGLIDEGLKMGYSIDKITNNIEKSTPKIVRTSRFRAERIAMTEVHTATNAANYEVAKNSDIPMLKVWLTAPGGVSKNERHTLISDLDGQKVGVDEPFSVGGVQMLFPGDPSFGAGAEDICNCKCSHAYEPQTFEF